MPTAVALFPADIAQPPRSWAERTYDVVRYTTMASGGHFAAVEEPDLLARDITEFVRELGALIAADTSTPPGKALGSTDRDAGTA